MGILYISEPFVMLLLSAMDGDRLISPLTVSCGKPFSIDHSLNCSFGGFPTIRHNELHDVTTNLLSQVCSNVQIEPHLQPLSGERDSSSPHDQARLDISAKGFWNASHELASFDVILWQRVLSISHFLLATENNEKNVIMRKGSVILSMEHSHHLLSPLPVAWDLLPLL